MGEGRDTAAANSRVSRFFIQNLGQIDTNVVYYFKGSLTTVYFTSKAVISDSARVITDDHDLGEAIGRRTHLKNDGAGEKYERLAIRLTFTGARANARIEGHKELEAKINYFVGPQQKWRTGTPTFEEVLYRNLYDGIDLKYFFTDMGLEYAFIVHPGADPGEIVRSYEGVDEIKIDRDGTLVLKTRFGIFTERPRWIYQDFSGDNVPVQGEFKLVGKKSVGFHIPSYDSKRPLFIEPPSLQ